MCQVSGATNSTTPSTQLLTAVQKHGATVSLQIQRVHILPRLIQRKRSAVVSISDDVLEEIESYSALGTVIIGPRMTMVSLATDFDSQLHSVTFYYAASDLFYQSSYRVN